MDDVGQAGNFVVALLDDGEGEDGQVHADDAATDGLSLALAGAAGAVAGVAFGEEKSDTGRVHDTLLHGETLLVVAAGDAEDVALELISEVVAGDFSAHLYVVDVLVFHHPHNNYRVEAIIFNAGYIGDIEVDDMGSRKVVRDFRSQ